MMKRFKALSLLLIGGFLAFGTFSGLNADARNAEASTSSDSISADSGKFTGWEANGLGSKYSDGSAKFDSTGDYVTKTNLFSGDVSSKMTKLEVTIQYKLNGSGGSANEMSITPYCSNAYKTEVSVSGFSSTSKTNKTITISSGLSNCTGFKLTYSNKSAGNIGVYKISWTATYNSATLTGISVTTQPTKTIYYIGDTLDTSGIVVTGSYSDSSTEDVTQACTFSPTTLNNAGAQSITVTHTTSSLTTTFSVTVNAARTITSVEVNGTLSKTEYVIGQSWDLTALNLKINWSTGDPTYAPLEDASTYSCDPTTANSLSITSFILSGTYSEHSFTKSFSVNVIDLAVSSLSRTGSTSFFYLTDTFNFAGSIKATWNDGLIEEGLTKDSISSETRTGQILTYALYNSDSPSQETLICSLAIGQAMSLDYNEKFVAITYCGVTSSAYQITVEDAVNYSDGAFYKVNTNRVDFSGTYIISAYASSNRTMIWSGTDATNEAISATTKDNGKLIEYSSEFAIVKFEAMTKSEIDGYSIQIMNGTNKGKYIGGTASSNKLNFNATPTFNSVEIDNESNLIKLISNTSIFSFNDTNSSGQRFRYYKSSTSFGSDYLYISLYEWKSNNDKATAFATDFNNANVCGTDNNTPAIASVWSEQATAFASLSTGAQNILKTGDALEGGNAIQDCLARYDRAVLRAVQRGTSSTINDFMSRISNSGTNFSIATTDNLNKLIPVIISGIAILGATSFGVLLILKRKKKEN